MKLKDWLFPKKSKVKTGFDIDSHLKEEAKKKRIRKGERRLREREIANLIYTNLKREPTISLDDYLKKRGASTR